MSVSPDVEIGSPWRKRHDGQLLVESDPRCYAPIHLLDGENAKRLRVRRAIGENWHGSHCAMHIARCARGMLRQPRGSVSNSAETALWHQMHNPLRLFVPFAVGATRPGQRSVRAWVQPGPKLLSWVGFSGDASPLPNSHRKVYAVSPAARLPSLLRDAIMILLGWRLRRLSPR